MLSLINGKITDKINITNRSLQFGDGVFETCKVENSKILLWEYHKNRLLKGCIILKINIDINLLESYIKHILSKVKNIGLKIIISRGDSSQGYKIISTLPNYILYTFDLAGKINNINLNFCELKYSYNKYLAGIKHQNRLEQILARGDGNDCIMLDVKDNIISTTNANIFIIKNNNIHTPNLENCGIEGTRREYLIDNLNIKIKDISKEELLSADEVFLTNAIFGIISVKSIDNINFVNNLTKQLQNKFNL